LRADGEGSCVALWVCFHLGIAWRAEVLFRTVSPSFLPAPLPSPLPPSHPTPISRPHLPAAALHRLIRDGGPLLLSFLVGALGMVAGAAVGALALRGPLEAAGGGKVAACLCASYVGGSVNFAAVAAVRRVRVGWGRLQMGR
jgi:hypothetical protein